MWLGAPCQRIMTGIVCQTRSTRLSHAPGLATSKPGSYTYVPPGGGSGGGGAESIWKMLSFLKKNLP